MTNDAAAGLRRCRRCGAEITGERHQGDDGVTWIWRCACGWASARTESGSVSRMRAREAIERARGKDAEQKREAQKQALKHEDE